MGLLDRFGVFDIHNDIMVNENWMINIIPEVGFFGNFTFIWGYRSGSKGKAQTLH